MDVTMDRKKSGQDIKWIIIVNVSLCAHASESGLSHFILGLGNTQ